MRTILIGAVESTRVALASMTATGCAPALVVTLPPERARRHSDYVDVEPLARTVGATVLHATDVNAPETLAAIERVAPDHALVIGWSQICGTEFLRMCGAGAIGYHPSLLPLNRGRGVIPWTILQRAHETGSTLIWLDEGMDSGDVLAQERIAVAAGETAASLYAKHMDALDRMLTRVLSPLERGLTPRTPQDHSAATFCARRIPSDGHIDWRRSADDVWALIRASGDPYPGAFTFRGSERLRVWDAALAHDGRYWGVPGQVQTIDDSGALVQCGDRAHVRLRTVQVDGQPPMHARDALRIHERLGLDPTLLLTPTDRGVHA